MWDAQIKRPHLMGGTRTVVVCKNNELAHSDSDKVFSFSEYDKALAFAQGVKDGTIDPLTFGSTY